MKTFPTGLIAALLLFSANLPAAPLIWQGDSGGVKITWNTDNLTAAIPGSGKSLYSAREEIEAEFQELQRDQETDSNGYEYQRSLSLRSLVGSLASIRHEEYYMQAGMPHPSIRTFFRVIDFAAGNKTVDLIKLFPENAILRALLADKIIQKGLNKQKPQTLLALQQILASGGLTVGECEYYLPDDFLSQFAFHHLKGKQVAVRLNLVPLYPPCQAVPSQLGIYLDIPANLQQDLQNARDKKAGFLMDSSDKLSGKQNTVIEFTAP